MAVGDAEMAAVLLHPFTLSPECPIGWDVKQKWRPFLISIFSAPLGARTLDPNIKSVVLYQLS